MTVTFFITEEYLIAYGLLGKLEHGIDFISFQELRDLSWKIQCALNNSGIDAIMKSNDLLTAINQFDNYFEYIRFNNVPYVRCKYTINICKLKKRFVENLPLDIQKLVEDVTDSIPF